MSVTNLLSFTNWKGRKFAGFEASHPPMLKKIKNFILSGCRGFKRGASEWQIGRMAMASEMAYFFYEMATVDFLNLTFLPSIIPSSNELFPNDIAITPYDSQKLWWCTPEAVQLRVSSKSPRSCVSRLAKQNLGIRGSCIKQNLKQPYYKKA